MGTPSDPTEPDYEDGGECAVCVDVIFNGHTPKYIRARFEGIIECPGVPPFDVMDELILKQTAENSCFYHVHGFVNGTRWDCDYHCHSVNPASRSLLTLQRDGVPVFSSRSTSSCMISFANQNTCVVPEIGREGTGAITWGPDIDEDAYDNQWV